MVLPRLASGDGRNASVATRVVTFSRKSKSPPCRTNRDKGGAPFVFFLLDSASISVHACRD
jgi:hypothetical protein